MYCSPVYACLFVFLLSNVQTVQATVAVSYKEVPKINGESLPHYLIGLDIVYWVAIMLYWMIILLLLSLDTTVILVTFFFSFFRAPEKTH